MRSDRKLYIGRKPVFSRDRRQLTDWLIRGTYPISFDAADDQLERMRKEGLPVQAIYSLPDLPGTLSGGEGQSHAPHPNAAKVFVNWIASKEGLEVYSRTRGGAPTRSDIDAKAYLPEAIIPKPDASYFDPYDWEFTVTKKKKIRAHMKKLVRGR